MSKADSIGGGSAGGVWRRLARSPAVASDNSRQRQMTNAERKTLRSGVRGLPVPPLSSVTRVPPLSAGPPHPLSSGLLRAIAGSGIDAGCHPRVRAEEDSRTWRSEDL